MESQQIYKQIKERRNTLHLQQKDLAELSGISLRTIVQLESEVGNPSLETLKQVAKVLGMEIKLVIKNK